MVLCAGSAEAQEVAALGYEVERKGKEVGRGFVNVTRGAGYTNIDYRMHIQVKVLGITMYSLESHQRAELDSHSRLVRARCSANVDGERFEVEVSRDRERYEIVVNGDSRIVDAAVIDSTTLHPIVSPPVSGTWLDLTNGKLVPYYVSSEGEGFVLRHEGAEDSLYYGEDGFLTELVANTPRGSLRMERMH